MRKWFSSSSSAAAVPPADVRAQRPPLSLPLSLSLQLKHEGGVRVRGAGVVVGTWRRRREDRAGAAGAAQERRQLQQYARAPPSLPFARAPHTGTGIYNGRGGGRGSGAAESKRDEGAERVSGSVDQGMAREDGVLSAGRGRGARALDWPFGRCVRLLRPSTASVDCARRLRPSTAPR